MFIRTIFKMTYKPVWFPEHEVRWLRLFSHCLLWRLELAKCCLYGCLCGLNGKTLVSGHPWMHFADPSPIGEHSGRQCGEHSGRPGREGLFPWTAIPLIWNWQDSNLTFKDSKTKWFYNLVPCLKLHSPSRKSSIPPSPPSPDSVYNISASRYWE